MSRSSLGFALALLPTVLVGGWFLTNHLVLRALGRYEVPRAWNMWWQYVQALDLPQAAPHVIRIKPSDAIGFGVPLVTWFGLLIPLLKAKPESQHCDASIAELADLEKARLLKQNPQSTLVGKYEGHHLWLDGAQRIVTIPRRIATMSETQLWMFGPVIIHASTGDVET